MKSFEPRKKRYEYTIDLRSYAHNVSKIQDWTGFGPITSKVISSEKHDGIEDASI